MIRTLLQNIPALIVTLPIFIAPLIAMIPSASKPARNFIWGIVFASMGLALAGSVYLFCVVYQTGPFSYFFGAWPPPKGIEYEATKLNTLLLILISGLAFMLMPYAKISVEAEISHKKTGLFYVNHYS